MVANLRRYNNRQFAVYLIKHKIQYIINIFGAGMINARCQVSRARRRPAFESYHCRTSVFPEIQFSPGRYKGWSQSCQSGANVVHGQKEGHIMPNRDGTGPKNQGSQSGQGCGKGQKQRGPGCRRGPKDGTGPGSGGGGMGRGQGAGKEDATDKSSKES